MNSKQIDKILSKNIKNFAGVYAADTLPRNLNKFPSYMVVNTDPISCAGTHWQAIIVLSKSNAEFFDSFGKKPKGEIAKYLQQFPNLKTNEGKAVQLKFEQSCGPHVIYFLVNRSIGKTFEQVLHRLSRPFSDAFVKFFLYNFVKLSSI